MKDKNFYKDLIDELIEKPIKDSVGRLSTYISLSSEDQDRESVQTRIKSRLYEIGHENDLFKNKKMYKEVADNVLDFTGDITRWMSGVAIFTDFDLDANTQSKVENEVRIVNTSLDIENKSFVGKIYDVNQLIWNMFKI